MTVSRAKVPQVSVPTTGSSGMLRQVNTATVLEVIKKSVHPVRLAEIVRATGLSRPTVETVAEGLLAQRWVSVDDPDEGSTGRSPGRPARRYSFNASAGHVVGVDIGAHNVAISVADLRGTSRATTRWRVSPSMPGEERLSVTAAAVSRSLDQAGLDLPDVFAVTVGTPGTVSPVSGRVGKAPGMPGWSSLDVAGVLGGQLTCNVALENDANLAALGEKARGVARGCADVLFLLLGERLGAGVICNGHLIRGRAGAAGELGYVAVPVGNVGRPGFGPLESMVNASALVELGRAEVARSARGRLAAVCDGLPGKLTAEQVTLAAAEGDKAATRVLRVLARRLARGIAPALLITNPDMLVLGGGISRAGEVLRDLVRDELEPLLLFPPDIRVSALGDEAVLTGAVDHALSRVDETILSRVSA